MSTENTPTTFAEAVTAFENASTWLAAPHWPALMALRKLAERLDSGDLTPALVAQYGLTYRSLAKAAPSATPTKTPLGAALDEARKAADG